MKYVDLILGLIAVTSALVLSSSGAMACSNGTCGIDTQVYFDLLNFSCHDGYQITDSGAQEIARLSASRKLDVPVFKQAYEKTCDFSEAENVASESELGQLDSTVYFDFLGYACNQGYVLTSAGAKKTAELVAERQIDPDTFKAVYYRTCNFDSAESVACIR